MKTTILTGGLLVLLLRAASAVEIEPGDIITPQFDNMGTILVVDPDTGDREILSLAPDIGSGPQMSRPTSIVMLPEGDFLVTDTFAHQFLTRIDRETGDRTDITTGDFETVLLDGGDPILVGDGSIYRVNLDSGQKTLISGQGVGSGPTFSFGGAGGAALGKNGNIFVGSYGSSAIYEVDLSTGMRSILSGPGDGSGPLLSHILDVLTLPDGQIIASGRNFSVFPDFTYQLFRIDPITGNRTLISSGEYPEYEYEKIAIGFDGHILGSNPDMDAIFSIDPSTGARTLISGDGLGSGPQIFWGDMVIFVPEPSAAVLLLFGLAILALTTISSKKARVAQSGGSDRCTNS